MKGLDKHSGLWASSLITESKRLKNLSKERYKVCFVVRGSGSNVYHDAVMQRLLRVFYTLT